MKRLFLFIFLLLFVVSILPAQLMPEDTDPKPYELEEFPDWAWSVRRFEVIMIGSYPLVYIFTTLIYDFTIYAYEGFAEEFTIGTQRDQQDLLNMFVISISISGAIAVLDMIIQVVKDGRETDE